jgi:hypothetical protein
MELGMHPHEYEAERSLKPRFISIKETSRVYGDSPVTIYRKIAAGKLIARKSGVKTLLEVESCEEHYTSLPRFIGKTGQAA